MTVSLVENLVWRYPKGMEEWRFFRIEYGGHAESCIVETGIWLPRGVDPEIIEGILESGYLPEKEK